jgi:hypothetical protein
MVLYYIYCIWVKTENGVLRYYGHTENMRVRKNRHVNHHNAWVKAGRPEKVSEVNGTRSVYVLDHEDWRMDVVDKIECETKDEARTLEGEWILKYDCVNMHVAGRTPQEYYETHKEQIKETKKQYYKNNEEKIKEKTKQYRHDHKEQHKEYMKQHYEQNKERIKEKRAEKVTCEMCGLVVKKGKISVHKKTKKCLAAKLSQPITNTNADALPSC